MSGVPYKCPDKGTCHHDCREAPCWRVQHCVPLSGVYPNDAWPKRERDAASAEHTKELLAAAVAELQPEHGFSDEWHLFAWWRALVYTRARHISDERKLVELHAELMRMHDQEVDEGRRSAFAVVINMLNERFKEPTT
jgi:hypothetical protein